MIAHCLSMELKVSNVKAFSSEIYQQNVYDYAPINLYVYALNHPKLHSVYTRCSTNNKPRILRNFTFVQGIVTPFIVSQQPK